MTSTVLKFLESMGYSYNKEAQSIIDKCDKWYCNKPTQFHERTNINGIKYTIPGINFAKRCCADDANLCEIVEINGGESTQFDGINALLDRSRFSVMYRKQLEKLSASGTVGCYIRLDNAEEQDGRIVDGRVAINYCDAENIIPLTVVNDEIIECAFCGSNLVKGKKEEVLVIFRLDESGRYIAESYYFTAKEHITSKDTTIQLGEVKPFSIMRTAEVNNIDGMEGYGLPKLYNLIPILEALDLAYYILYGDLDKGEKIVFINELLACITTQNGVPTLTPQQKKLFVMLGQKLPNQDNVIKEYNPELRINEITSIFETLLSLLSMSFGFGTKKYTFEGGQIKSATEYIGERQDAMQELNKQRDESKAYIKGIVDALIWFSNQFEGTAFTETDVCVEFDDSFVVDKNSRLERMRDDAMTFDIPQLKVWYLMDAYNLAEDEAKALVGIEAELKDRQALNDIDGLND